MDWDALWIDGTVATLDPRAPRIGSIPDGALAVREGQIAWVGARAHLPAPPGRCAAVVHRMEGGWLTPGLIDCHTHLVFGGDRSEEFQRRLAGESYEAIAREGGGIATTVSATRVASDDALRSAARSRLERLLAEGVTTVEVKSGYGLELETELRLLRVIRRLGEEHPVQVRSTFLGLHALPGAFRDRREDYLDMVTRELLPRVVAEGLADGADAFCEGIAFTPEECRSFLSAAGDAGLTLHLHADQLTDTGGAALAAGLGAASADHLECTSPEGVRAMAEAGTVAVLLPGAYLGVGGPRPPPVEGFRKAGVPMAVATDLNPGTSPVASLLAAMALGCRLFGITPGEALTGVTRNAAAALGLRDRGVLTPGARGDLTLWRVGHPRELSYWLGANPCAAVWVAGERVG